MTEVGDTHKRNKVDVGIQSENLRQASRVATRHGGANAEAKAVAIRLWSMRLCN